MVIYRWLRTGLSHPAADRVILWLGFMLLLPSLPTGLAADDYLHTIMMDRPAPIPGFERAPLDIFRFCDPRFSRALMDDGILPWWDDPEVRIALMRPLTAATHWLDHALWRGVDWPMHLHSALWALLLLFGVRALYRETIADRFLANLAFALYALDDARGWLVSWVAARNAVVATAISVWALVVHLRHRRGEFPAGVWLAPVLLAIGVLGSEGALAIGGYVLGSALFLEQGPLVRRLLRLWPYAVVVIVWRIPYQAFDFGAIGSGLYTDPLREPLRFLRMFAENAPLLLGSQLGAMWSDAWLFIFILPRVQLAVYVATCLLIAVVAVALWPRVRASGMLRAFGFGAILALVPASPTFVSDRLLTWIAIGACVLLAALIAPVLQRATLPEPERAPRWVAALGALLIGLHLIGVAFLPSRARGNLVMRAFFDRAHAGVSADPSIADRTLVFVNPPHLAFVSYLAIERAAQHRPRPRVLRTLATSTTELSVTRIDPQRLRLRPRGGFLQNPSSRLGRSEARPFQAGQQVQLSDMQVEVRQITSDGRPLEVEVRFGRALEDPLYVWRQWVGAAAVPFTPPAMGQTVVLPSVDYAEALFGFEFPISMRL